MATRAAGDGLKPNLARRQGVGTLHVHRLVDVAPYKKSQPTTYPFLFQSAFIMSQYPVPPPSYGSTSPSPKSPNAPLYSGSRYQGEPGPSAGIYNQPAPGDLPDDFKVRLS